jgi:hypothetical protein
MGVAVTSRVTGSAVEQEVFVLSEDTRWQLAQRIAASDIFVRSEFLPRFLLHICELYLLGRTDEIKEQQIGVRVFNRPPTYNPGDDNIVRNYAVQLRRRLSLYFDREGQHEPFTIEIPRGGYVPVFHPRVTDAPTLPAAAAVSDREEAEPPDWSPESLRHGSSRKADWRMFLAGLGIGVLMLAVAAIVFRQDLWHPAPATQASIHPLWSTIFSKNRDTFIVPADSGLGILQNLSEEPADLTAYLNGEYLANVAVKGVDQNNLNDLRTQRYTSMVDLTIASRLSRLPEVVPDHLFVKYARDLRIDDLQNANAILLGAIHTDPWISVLQGGRNFQFACGKRVNDCYILNSHPSQSEQPVYRSDLGGPAHETYAIVALLPNLDRTGWILLIEGLNMAGTEAAANILFDDSAMRPLIQKAMSRDGSLRPFELLIKTGSLGADALPARIVASRLGE